MSAYPASIEPTGVLVPVGARTPAGTLETNLGSLISKGVALEGLYPCYKHDLTDPDDVMIWKPFLRFILLLALSTQTGQQFGVWVFL